METRVKKARLGSLASRPVRSNAMDPPERDATRRRRTGASLPRVLSLLRSTRSSAPSAGVSVSAVTIRAKHRTSIDPTTRSITDDDDDDGTGRDAGDERRGK